MCGQYLKSKSSILIALTFVVALSSPLGAQTFAPIPGLAFTKPFAGANPLPQTLTVLSTAAKFDFRVTTSTSTGGSWLSVTGCGGYCDTPQVITVTVNPATALAVGTYTGQIVLTEYYGTFTMTVPVTLTIAQASGPYLDNLPGQVSFSLKTGGSTPPSQSIQIRNGGSGTLNWTLAPTTSNGANWLSASALSGTTPGVVTLTVVKANLPSGGAVAGTFIGHLVFQTASGNVTVPVSVRVGDDGFSQTNAISFTKVFAGADPLPQILTIASTGTNFDFIVTESTATGGDWLSVTGCGGYCNTPQAITAAVNANVSLPAGTYTGQIVLTEYFGSRSITVAVTLTVAPGGTAFLGDVPGQMSFSLNALNAGGLPPPSQTLEIRNGGAGTLPWTLSASTADSGDWLIVSAPSGTAPSLVSTGVSVPNLPGAGLVPGTFIGQLVIQSAGSSITVPVSVVVSDKAFRQVNAISFTKPFAGANSLPQTLTIASTATNFDFTVVSYTATGGDWLTVSGCGGYCNTPQSITATVNPSASLAAGTYTGQIVLAEYYGSMAMTVPVTLTVGNTSAGPLFDNVPGQMSFSLTPGSGNPPAQPVHIRNAGTGTLNWTVSTSTSDGGNWLTVSAANGTAPSMVNVSVSANALPSGGQVPGTYSGELVFRTAGSSVTVPVSVVVGASVFAQANSLNFAKAFGGANPLPQTFTVSSTGAAFDFTAAAFTATGGNWLSVSGCGGYCNTPQAITATVNPNANLPAGVYTGQLVFTEYYNSMAMTVPVTLTVGTPPACTFSLSTQTLSATADGLTGKLQLTATGAPPCPWTSSSSLPWVQFFPTSGNGSASIDFTVYPNFGTSAKSGQFSIAGLPITATQASNARTQAERFVQVLYFNFFGRLPSPSELAFWVNSGQTRLQMVLSFYNSTEFNLGGRFVAGLYVGLLDRDAEYSGWLFQRNAFATNIVTQDNLVRNFINAPEYILKFGSPDNAAYVRLLYRYILLREASQNEVNNQVNELLRLDGLGAEERVVLARAFLNSNEFRNGTGPRLTAFLIYATLLFRDGSAAERKTVEDQLKAGVPIETIFGGFLGTPEFNANLN